MDEDGQKERDVEIEDEEGSVGIEKGGVEFENNASTGKLQHQHPHRQHIQAVMPLVMSATNPMNQLTNYYLF